MDQLKTNFDAYFRERLNVEKVMFVSNGETSPSDKTVREGCCKTVYIQDRRLDKIGHMMSELYLKSA